MGRCSSPMRSRHFHARFGVAWPLVLLALVVPFPAPAAAAPLDSVQQLILSVSPTWDSKSGRLQLFERDGKGWKAIGQPWAVLYGKNGLAWGRGVLGTTEPGTHKTERDMRAPAGVF